MLTRLTALSPAGLAHVNAAVRQTCASTLGLTPLPADAEPAARPDVLAFAEQFSTDVAAFTPEQRSAFLAATGDAAFAVVALIFIADYVPRVLRARAALRLDSTVDSAEWDRDTNPGDLLLNHFAPTVARMRALDPVTTEIVRLRGAAQHNCRLCRSLRDGDALEGGGSEPLYDDIAQYETSNLLTDRHKAALRYVDALIWTPAHIPEQTADAVRAHFRDDEADELTLDVMRNACNKIAVAFGADAPRVQQGTERYTIGADGHPVYGQKSSSV